MANATDTQPDKVEISEEERFLELTGWTRVLGSGASSRWKEAEDAHKKSFRNEITQREFTCEGRVYRTDEAIRIQKLRDETAVYDRKMAEDREKRRVRPAPLVGAK
jgi:hypothetical protein